MGERLPQRFERERGLDGGLRVLSFSTDRSGLSESASPRVRTSRENWMAIADASVRTTPNGPRAQRNPRSRSASIRWLQALRDLSGLQQGFAEQMVQAPRVAAGLILRAESIGQGVKLGQRLAERRGRFAVRARRERGGSGRLPVRLGALRAAGPAPVQAERRRPGLPGLGFGFEEGRNRSMQPASVLERQEMIDRLLRQGVVEPIARIGVGTLDGEHSEFDELVEPLPQRDGVGRPVVERQQGRDGPQKERCADDARSLQYDLEIGRQPIDPRDYGPLDRVGQAQRGGLSGSTPVWSRRAPSVAGTL